MKKRETREKKDLLRKSLKGYIIKVSEHAEERIIERMECSKSKVYKIASKALVSKEKIANLNVVKRQYVDDCDNQHKTYKLFLGCIFVFGIKYLPDNDRYHAGLITVFKYNKKNKPN